MRKSPSILRETNNETPMLNDSASAMKLIGDPIQKKLGNYKDRSSPNLEEMLLNRHSPISSETELHRAVNS